MYSAKFRATYVTLGLRRTGGSLRSSISDYLIPHACPVVIGLPNILMYGRVQRPFTRIFSPLSIRIWPTRHTFPPNRKWLRANQPGATHVFYKTVRIGQYLLAIVHPHSLNPQMWHFMHPSAISSWLWQSGQVPMKVSLAS